MIMIDMKMPKCCIGCPILRDYYGWEAYCPFVHENNLKERTDRPSECPLKEIEESELRSSEKPNNQYQIQKTKGAEIITKQQALDILSCRPDLNDAEILALNILKSDYIDCTEIVQSAVDRGLEAVIKSVREALQLESAHAEKAIVNLEKQSSEPTVTYKEQQVREMALEFIYNYKTKSEGKI